MRKPLRPLSQRRPRRKHITAEQLGALSHELRTPLNGVLGMARLLERTELSAEQRAYAEALRESGQHLLNLVNDLVDYAKLGAGKLELASEPVDLEVLLRSVCELLAPRAREKGIELGWSAFRGLGRVAADEGRLRQILLNFAGNALKFTDTGGVLIAVSEPAAGRLRFTVEDTGPGVPAVDRERIFEAFAQADAARDQPGGAGLGLAISRSLAQAMGGEVGVGDAALGGAAFWFEAPFARAAGGVRAEAALDGLTVGVASANPVVREAGRRQLSACGARSVSGETLEALIARTEPGDALLLDRPLAEACIRRLPNDRRVIVLLASDERGRIAAFRDAGAAGYLMKPLRRGSLGERVLIATGRLAELAAPADDEPSTAAAPGVRVLLVEDDRVNALLARTLLTREGCEVDHVSSGHEALATTAVGAYDVILMDMRMPGLSGEETARRLRARGVATPIVALTANAFEDDRQACLAAGMNDFISKPLSAEGLRAVLTRWGQARWTPPAARAKVG